jgi:hypothetical protein
MHFLGAPTLHFPTKNSLLKVLQGREKMRQDTHIDKKRYHTHIQHANSATFKEAGGGRREGRPHMKEH